MERRALVLGSGGHAASAWQIGVIIGLAEAGIDLRDADLFVGTSAGALVAVRITSGLALEDLYRREIESDPQERDASLPEDFNRWRASFMSARAGPGGTIDILKRFGALGLAAPASPRANPRVFAASQLLVCAWPEQDLRVVAVDAESAERRAFGRADGVELVDAVAASCAVPGLRQLVTIEGRHYMDGGVHSIDNADLATGCDRVVVLTLRARVPPICVVPLEASLATLRDHGARVEAIHPDHESEAAFAAVGGNVLDPAVRVGAATAGRRQGGSAMTLQAITAIWERNRR